MVNEINSAPTPPLEPPKKPYTIIPTKNVLSDQTIANQAKGKIKDTDFSVLQTKPDQVEIALWQGKNHVGEPIIMDAKPESLEEVADTIARHLKSGVDPEKLLQIISELDAKNLRSQFDDILGPEDET